MMKLLSYIALAKAIINKLLGNKYPSLTVVSEQISHRAILNKLWDIHYPSKVLPPGETLILLPGTLFELFDEGRYWKRAINKRIVFSCDESILYRVSPINEPEE